MDFVKVFVATILLAMFICSNWLWDVAHIVHFHGPGVLTNGVWDFSALLTYHLAWYCSIGFFLLLFILYLIELTKSKGGRK